MGAHDILTMYSTKPLEYLVGIFYLVLFIPFWRFMSPPARAAEATARERARSTLRDMVEGFLVPQTGLFHRGHAWARPEGELVVVGMDDFAHRLVGPVDSILLPQPGAHVAQGEKAWTLEAAGRAINMLAPVDGEVVETNKRAAAAGAELDPYGEGWLLKVKPRRFADDASRLLAGPAARQWMEATARSLQARASGELGQVLQDGGTPVHGIARAIDAAKWDEIAREYLEGQEKSHVG